MNRSSQIQMTNEETRRNDEILNDETSNRLTQSFSIFGLRISFEIPHSSFNDLCVSGSWSQCMWKKRKGALHLLLRSSASCSAVVACRRAGTAGHHHLPRSARTARPGPAAEPIAHCEPFCAPHRTAAGRE